MLSASIMCMHKQSPPPSSGLLRDVAVYPQSVKYLQAEGKRKRDVDSDEEMAAPDPFKNETVLGEGNEAYRIYDEPGDVPTAQGGGSAQYTYGGGAYPAR